MGLLRKLTRGGGGLNDILNGLRNLKISLEGLADDPLWDRGTEDILFFNHQIPIKNLLDYCGYRPTSDSIDGLLGKWQVFKNEEHLIGIYIGRLPKTRKQSTDCDTARFMVSTPADTNRKEFVNDLEIVTKKSLEMIGADTVLNTFMVGMMVIGSGAAGFYTLINLPDKYAGWFIVPTMLAGGAIGALWGLQDYLGFGAHLSSSAANY